MVPARIQNQWENAKTSLWFIPSILTLVAIILSIALPEIDKHIGSSFGRNREFIFYGSADSARSTLSAIAGSLITVISVLFSITILTLQQASTQFTPRIFRNFTRDRGAQAVLGAYIATFVYALSVLRQVRGQEVDGGEFVPIIGITVALMLAFTCIALLVYYIHHAATLFQASTVIDRVHNELVDAINNLYPNDFGNDADVPDDSLNHFKRGVDATSGSIIYCTSAGFIQAIDEDAIGRAVPDGSWAIIHSRIGQYVGAGSVLVEVGATEEQSSRLAETVRAAFVLGKERTMRQDPMFGIRQLVDIALKALSPGINDPTTAEHALSSVGDAIGRLSRRRFPSRTRVLDTTGDGAPKTLWVDRPTFAEFVGDAFDQIRRTASQDVHVLHHLLTVLTGVGRMTAGTRREVIRSQIDRTIWHIEQLQLEPSDRDMLLSAAVDAINASQIISPVIRGDERV